MPNLFQSQRKGVSSGNYKYMDETNGKIINTGTDDKELATKFMLEKGLKVEITNPSFADLATAISSSTTTAPTIPSTITTATIPDEIIPSEPKATKAEKPAPGTIRKNGLSELSPAKIGKLKEALASIVASGNIDAIRLSFSLLGFETADLDPNGQALLSLGWEAQLEELFVNGLPPPWLILIIANITLCVKLGLSAKIKGANAPIKVQTIGEQQNK